MHKSQNTQKMLDKQPMGVIATDLQDTTMFNSGVGVTLNDKILSMLKEYQYVKAEISMPRQLFKAENAQLTKAMSP